MIRINLLPFRLARKRENIRRQVSIYLLTVALILIGLYWYTTAIDKSIAHKRNEIVKINIQIDLYKEKAEKVGKIKKKLKILEDKLRIVESLKQRRSEQLTLLEKLPEQLVPERMWIDTLRSDETGVTLSGIAFDNPTVADFMNRLEASEQYDLVDLKRTGVRSFDGGVDLKAFELYCRKRQPQPAAAQK